MKYSITRLYFAFIIALATGCQAQEKWTAALIEKVKIENLKDTLPSSIFTHLEDGKVAWRPAFQYMDNLEVFDITYMSNELRIKGYAVQPIGTGPYPTIIWNRGGVKEFGALNLISVAGMMGKLASQGYLVIGSQYRGNGGSEGIEEYGGAEIDDILNLIPAIKQWEKADAKRIGIFGGSRGGLMTYQALRAYHHFKAACVLAAPADKRTCIQDRPSLENSLYELVPDYERNKEFELDRRSAILWADEFPKDVPILLMHGNADWRVKSTESLRMALELDRLRIPYRLKIYEGGDHGLSEHRAEFYEDLIAWFDKYLKSDTQLPNMEFHGR